MPEIFKNSVTRRVGDVTSNTEGSIAANATSLLQHLLLLLEFRLAIWLTTNTS